MIYSCLVAGYVFQFHTSDYTALLFLGLTHWNVAESSKQTTQSTLKID